MTFLPIVERELRVAAKQATTYRSRMALPMAASAMLLFFAFFVLAGMPQHMIGRQLFHLSFGMLFLSCLLAGCQLTADTISGEKREGTLGFLFLTNLKGHDIVLGKLVSSSIGAIYGVLSLLPLVAVMFLFGGVTGGSMLRLTLSSLNVLFLSLALGITCSCLGRDANNVRGAALLWMVLLIAIGPLVGFINSYLLDFPSSHRTLGYWGPFLMVSPAMTFPASLDSLYFRSSSTYWITNSLTHAMGWFFLLFASWLVPRTWQEKAASKGEFRWREWWRRWVYGTSESMAVQRARLLDINAVHWLTGRERFKSLALWFFIAVMFLGWSGFWFAIGNSWIETAGVFLFYLLTNSIIKAWIAVESAKRFSADRESGGLELLLCTSLPVTEIVRGQLLSVRRQFLVPLMVVSCLEVLLTLSLCWLYPRLFSGWELVMLLAGFVVLWADYFTLPWVGMWKAMVSKKPKSAGVEAAAVVLGQPWWILWLWMGLVKYLLWQVFHHRLQSEYFVFGSWLMICLGFDLFWIRYAKKRLHAEFRTIAMTRYVEQDGLSVWGRLGRLIGRCKRKFFGRPISD